MSDIEGHWRTSFSSLIILNRVPTSRMVSIISTEDIERSGSITMVVPCRPTELISPVAPFPVWPYPFHSLHSWSVHEFGRHGGSCHSWSVHSWSVQSWSSWSAFSWSAKCCQASISFWFQHSSSRLASSNASRPHFVSTPTIALPNQYPPQSSSGFSARSTLGPSRSTTIEDSSHQCHHRRTDCCHPHIDLHRQAELVVLQDEVETPTAPSPNDRQRQRCHRAPSPHGSAAHAGSIASARMIRPLLSATLSYKNDPPHPKKSLSKKPLRKRNLAIFLVEVPSNSQAGVHQDHTPPVLRCRLQGEYRTLRTCTSTKTLELTHLINHSQRDLVGQMKFLIPLENFLSRVYQTPVDIALDRLDLPLSFWCFPRPLDTTEETCYKARTATNYDVVTTHDGWAPQSPFTDFSAPNEPQHGPIRFLNIVVHHVVIAHPNLPVNGRFIILRVPIIGLPTIPGSSWGEGCHHFTQRHGDFQPGILFRKCPYRPQS